MQRPLALAVIVFALVLAACGDDDDDSNKVCQPTCGPCQACDTSGDTPVCQDLCAPGTSCVDGQCAAPATCEPACKACQVCDTSGSTPTCVDSCQSGLSCENGKCVAPTVSKCEPACGPCQNCDTSGATPVCTDVCGSGLTCDSGKCVAPAAATCQPACGACQYCDTSGSAPTCVDNCAPGLSCNNGTCELPGDPCAGACKACQRCDTTHGVPFCVDRCPGGLSCDVTSGTCWPGTKTSFDHSNLSQLSGPFTADIAGGKAVTQKCLGCHPKAGQQMLDTAHYKWIGPTPNLVGHTGGATVGKRNLINNFCVSIPKNEQRCSHCHPSYGYKDATFDFTNIANIDCLSCHSSAYKRGKTTTGPDTTVDMVAAAKAVGLTTRSTCGSCHFKAGGGDFVKSMGSSLASPAATADVHMGHASTPFTCADCHTSSGHRIAGQGVHVPISEGRVGCVDCHGGEPHAGSMASLLDNHAKDVACQTCHVPAYARQQATKVDWDWSTAGDRTRGTNGIINITIGTQTLPSYDAMKGDFVWKTNVRPTYAWYDGRMKRMTLKDSFPAGAGTQTNRIELGKPVAAKSDAAAKITPFKVMRGRQAVDTTARLVIAPHLFGAGGFWPLIPAAGDYTAAKVENNWTQALTNGARAAGQIGASDSYSGRASGSRPWDWAYTEMWMGVNHEVAPKAQALGCNSCHGAPASQWDWAALGYSCDPKNDPKGCGSRNR